MDGASGPIAAAPPRGRAGTGPFMTYGYACVSTAAQDLVLVECAARGHAAAKAQGVRFGRKPKLTPYRPRKTFEQRDVDGELPHSVACSYDLGQSMTSRLAR